MLSAATALICVGAVVRARQERAIHKASRTMALLRTRRYAPPHLSPRVRRADASAASTTTTTTMTSRAVALVLRGCFRAVRRWLRTASTSRAMVLSKKRIKQACVRLVAGVRRTAPVVARTLHAAVISAYRSRLATAIYTKCNGALSCARPRHAGASDVYGGAEEEGEEDEAPATSDVHVDISAQALDRDPVRMAEAMVAVAMDDDESASHADGQQQRDDGSDDAADQSHAEPHEEEGGRRDTRDNTDEDDGDHDYDVDTTEDEQQDEDEDEDDDEDFEEAPTSMVVIVCGDDAQFDALRSALFDDDEDERGLLRAGSALGVPMVSGYVGDVPCVAVATGGGVANAARATQAVVDTIVHVDGNQVTCVLCCVTVTALSPLVGVDHVLVPSEWLSCASLAIIEGDADADEDYGAVDAAGHGSRRAFDTTIQTNNKNNNHWRTPTPDAVTAMRTAGGNYNHIVDVTRAIHSSWYANGGDGGRNMRVLALPTAMPLPSATQRRIVDQDDDADNDAGADRYPPRQHSAGLTSRYVANDVLSALARDGESRHAWLRVGGAALTGPLLVGSHRFASAMSRAYARPLLVADNGGDVGACAHVCACLGVPFLALALTASSVAPGRALAPFDQAKPCHGRMVQTLRELIERIAS